MREELDMTVSRESRRRVARDEGWHGGYRERTITLTNEWGDLTLEHESMGLGSWRATKIGAERLAEAERTQTGHGATVEKDPQGGFRVWTTKKPLSDTQMRDYRYKLVGRRQMDGYDGYYGVCPKCKGKLTKMRFDMPASQMHFISCKACTHGYSVENRRKPKIKTKRTISEKEWDPMLGATKKKGTATKKAKAKTGGYDPMLGATKKAKKKKVV
jgi:hypothetical protein